MCDIVFKKEVRKLRYFKLLFYVLSLLILLPLSNCIFDSDDDDGDNCDNYIEPQVSVTVQYTISVFYRVGIEQPQRLADATMDIQIYKKLCNAEETGIVEFNNSHTQEDGLYTITPASYNLHNSLDMIMFHVEIEDFIAPVNDSTISIDLIQYGSHGETIRYDDASSSGGTVNETITITLPATRPTPE